MGGGVLARPPLARSADSRPLHTPVSGPARQTCTRTSAQHTEEQESADAGAGLPADFDWEAYLYWRPDLREKGIDTEEGAKEHFLNKGRQKRLLYKRYCMVMVYDTEGGNHGRRLGPYAPTPS